jgi:hypothetical protein
MDASGTKENLDTAEISVPSFRDLDSIDISQCNNYYRS